MAAEYTNSYVGAAPLLVLWGLLLLVSLPCGVATAAKGRWVWFAAGFLAGFVPWIGTAFLRPLPDSPWALWWTRRATRRGA
ncbi:MAG TPA: hypothetical protein VGO80_07110 [Solirubrobacteraceae bacterium]|jgi:hypothetical protein|nr:hypothetical protein [Solirubrobacteraceae bacterium]